jgi:hypothetical protein
MRIMSPSQIVLSTYRVRVGHWEISVKARSEEEAIVLARRAMACELPRLYDVIRTLTACRFRVEAAA